MSSGSKTIFLSYQRTNRQLALAIFQSLTAQGYDVFFDYKRMGAKNFEQTILENIASRTHFIAILMPSAHVRLSDTHHHFRREIDHAIATERHIITVQLQYTHWDTTTEAITRKADWLDAYTTLRIQPNYFTEAMTRLYTRYLKTDNEITIHPRTTVANRLARNAQKFAQIQKAVPHTIVDDALHAESYFLQSYEIPKSPEREHFYTKAIALNPDFVEAYHERGDIRFIQDALAGALADYNKAIRIDPIYASAYNHRGILHQAQNDLTSALTDHSQAIRLNPQSAEAYNNRGNVYLALGDIEKALTDYEQAIHLNPRSEAMYNNRGLAYALQGDNDRALADYYHALELNPYYIEPYNNRANLYHLQGNLDHALRDYDRALQIDVTHALTYRNRATLHTTQENYVHAIDDYESYLKFASGISEDERAEILDIIYDLDSKY